MTRTQPPLQTRQPRPPLQTRPCVLAVGFLLSIALLWRVPTLQAAPRATQPQRVREIFVPFEDLNVILESGVRRVFLKREQYEDLLDRVRTSPEDPAPFGALVVAAEYQGRLEQGRTRLAATLHIDVLRDGLQHLPLRFNGIGIRGATLDDLPAPLARQRDGSVSVFVSGKGRHVLKLDLLAPLQTTAAEQSLNITVPTPPNTRLHLVAQGNVEVKSGAAVASRTLIDGATHLELLPPRGPLAVVMSLNNRESQTRQVVVARSVLVDEVTQGYERLHARVAMNVMYGEAQQFRFALPAGFEVNQVRSPLLAQWAVETTDGQKILTVRLREPTSGTIPLNIALIKTTAQLEAWQMPRLTPLDVAGQVAVVGVLAEQRIAAEQIVATGLIPIGNQALTSSIPQSVFEAEPGAPTIRSVVTYYAPQAEYGLSARFVAPPAQHEVVSNLMLTVSQRQLALRASFTVVPTAEKLFVVKIDVPPGWHVGSVSDGGQQSLSFEQIAGDNGSLLRIRLPAGAPVQSATDLYVDAVAVPDDWLSDWQDNKITFPAFVVRDAEHDRGALSVVAQDDLIVRPDQVEGLTSLDRQDRVNYGLQNVATSLAYFFDRQPYRASLTVERRAPWVTARTYSFLEVLPEKLKAHYEVEYLVQQAAVRKLTVRLPADTPDSLSIKGLDGVRLKEFSSTTVEGARHWTILLADRRRGRIRLAVDFEQRLEAEEPKNLPLPLIAAENVSFQSGHFAVEGSPELDVQVVTTSRQVDVGELSDADYMPKHRLLGAYAYGGATADVTIDVFRHPSYALPSAIVERAEMVTAIAANGISQTVARYDLRTKASYLEIELPDGANLWSAFLDGKPSKPQRDGKVLLLSLPAKKKNAKRNLQVVFESSSETMDLMGTINLAAPKLYLRMAPDQPRAEVPVADIVWEVDPPDGYEIVASDGTVYTNKIRQRQSPLVTVIKAAYWLAGSADPFSMYRNIQSVRHEAYDSVVILSDGSRSMQNGSASEPIAADYYQSEEQESEGSDEDEKSVEMPSSRITTEATPQPPSNAPAALQPADPNSDVDALGVIDGKSDSISSGKNEVESDEMIFDIGADKRADPAFQSKPSRGKSKLNWKSTMWAMEGLSSLRIEVQKTDQAVKFQSLGVNPQLRATLIEVDRVGMLSYAVALTILLIGILLTRRPLGKRVRYIVGVVLISSLLPLLTDWTSQLGDTFDMAFFAACLLIPYYLVIALLCGFVRLVQGGGRRHATGALTATMLLLMAAAIANVAQAAPPATDATRPIVVQIAPPAAPVVVPKDAIIVPYDLGDGAEIGLRIRNAEKVLVPYNKYVELWNRAYPDKRIETDRPVVDYALAGGQYAARLDGDEFLLVQGHLDVELYTDKVVSIPLTLSGGVLTEATLDDQPARLRFVRAAAPQTSNNSPARQQAQAPNADSQQQIGRLPPQDQTMVVLLASGKGRHRLDLAVRLPLTRRGGWRRLSGNLPAAPATALTLDVPLEKTEVRLSGVNDRGQYETAQANETIETVLGAAGQVQLEWRPRVAEGTVDRSLTAQSQAVFDVRQDGTQLMWRLTVDFGRTERQSFTLVVPADYLIQRIVGDNVRGWDSKPADGGQQVEVHLLKASQGQQSVTLQLARHAAFGEDETTRFDTPTVAVVGAALHRGSLTVRRSPILELQTVESQGVTRMDTSAEASLQLAKAVGAEESPLGIKDFEAYRFVTTPFQVRLSATPIRAETSANLQSIVRVAQREITLESLIRYQVKGRPIYQVKIALPEKLDLDDNIGAPEPFEWAVAKENDKRVLTIHMGVGQLGDFPISVGGTIKGGTDAQSAGLPQLSVLGVGRQAGDIVVQVDPAFDVRAQNIQNCQNVLPERVHSWLTGRRQRELARLVLRYRGSDYAGSLVFTRRQPRVACRTISNVKITDSTIEETVLLDFTIRDAGIRQVVFLLPDSMKAARISAPQLRQTTITPVEGQSQVRVQLDLQEDIMGQLGVKIVHDHLLADQTHTAPIPEVQTGETDRQFVILENAGRDEVIVDQHPGLELLSRQQQQWRELAAVLGNQLTQAYIVRKGSTRAQLDFATKERTAVETARATIGLALAQLIVDGNGAYRGVQEYLMDNKVEQFLEIDLPQGASLWSASVAGTNAKPIEVSSGATSKLQIPLIKTAKGDLDYSVVLKYGGTLDSIGRLQAVGFPLIRTVNINVETSQVRLHLPENFKWFDFGGDMTLATETQLTAGRISYNTACISNLAQIMSSSDDYARVRAVENYRRFARRNSLLVNRQGQLARQDDSLKATFGSNKRAVELAQSQLRDIAIKEKELEKGVAVDNRWQLDQVFGEQRNDRANDVVKDLDSNFNYAEELTKSQHRDPSQGQQDIKPGLAGQQFNQQWLEGNSLFNEEMPEEQSENVTGNKNVGGRYQDAQKKPSPADNRYREADAGRGRGKGANGYGLAGPPAKGQLGLDSSINQLDDGEASDKGVGDNAATKAKKYQEKLQKQLRDSAGEQHGGGQESGEGGGGQGMPQVLDEGYVGDVDGDDGIAIAAGTLTASIPGMASLDVEFTPRGRVYLFTTPRGNAPITARAIAMPTIIRLQSLAWVIGVVTLALFVARWIRRGGLTALRGRRGGTILMVLGLACLLTSILPWAGLLAILIGVCFFFAPRRIASTS